MRPWLCEANVHTKRWDIGGGQRGGLSARVFRLEMDKGKAWKHDGGAAAGLELGQPAAAPVAASPAPRTAAAASGRGRRLTRSTRGGGGGGAGTGSGPAAASRRSEVRKEETKRFDGCLMAGREEEPQLLLGGAPFTRSGSLPLDRPLLRPLRPSSAFAGSEGEGGWASSTRLKLRPGSAPSATVSALAATSPTGRGKPSPTGVDTLRLEHPGGKSAW